MNTVPCSNLERGPTTEISRTRNALSKKDGRVSDRQSAAFSSAGSVISWQCERQRVRQRPCQSGEGLHMPKAMSTATEEPLCSVRPL